MDKDIWRNNSQKPQFREFPFKMQIFKQYSRVVKSLINTIAEFYLYGVSTRRVQKIVSHLGIEQSYLSGVSMIGFSATRGVGKSRN